MTELTDQTDGICNMTEREETREEVRSGILRMLNDFITLYLEYTQHPETIAMKARWSSRTNPVDQIPGKPDIKHTNTNNFIYTPCYEKNNLDTQLCDNLYDDSNTLTYPKNTLINKYQPNIAVNREGSGSESSPPTLSDQDTAPTTLSGGER